MRKFSKKEIARYQKLGGVPFEEHLKEQLKNPEYRRHCIREGIKLRVAYKIHGLRHKLGLTQSELARKVGTTQSHIARMEHADTENYEVKTLQRIAEAAGKKLVINFV